MDTDPLLCGLCVHELGAEASVMSVDGGPVKSAPGPEHLGEWLEWACRSYAPVQVNRNPLCTLWAVTLVHGTAVCAGHIQPLLNRYPRVFE